jgi:hypothetical protein
VTPIRPQLPPTTPSAPRPGNDARAAFFQAVKGSAPAQAAAAPAAVQARPQLPIPATTRVEAKAEPAAQPQRYLRPGSLLDIKV